MINVLIAEDHAVVRKGLRQVIQEQMDMTVVGEASDGFEALQMICRDDWDVLVLDISLPFRNGMEILKDVRRNKPQQPVLILSAHPEAEFGIRTLKAGAAGYLNKATDLADLIAAIRKVVQGGKYVSPTLADRFIFDANDATDQDAHGRLTDRENDVIRMLSTGKSLGEIGLALSLSVKTISTYRARALHKLGLKSNGELTRYIIERDQP